MTGAGFMATPELPRVGNGVESDKHIGGDDGIPLVVGYAFMPKKLGTMARIVQDPSAHEEEGRTVEFRAIDMERPLEEQVRVLMISFPVTLTSQPTAMVL